MSLPDDVAELDRFERFCSNLELENGDPLRLAAFQREMLAQHFGGAIETLILIAKKNGKSTLLAALALYHLIATADAECVIGATSRDQATILYDQAAGFVRRSAALGRHVDVKRGYRELRSRRDSGRVRVLAADVDTADGVIPTLALVDELGRHRSAELYAIFRDGLGPRRGQMIAISVAGTTTTSPLGAMRSAAYRLPEQHREGAHRWAVSPGGGYVMHEWALEPGEDVDNMNLVKLANPAPWHTVERLRERHDSPSMTPWDWRRFACNIWQATAEPWLPAGAWEALAEPGLVLRARAKAWLGVFRLRESGAAVVAVTEHPTRRGAWACSARVLENTASRVDLADVEEEVRLAAVRLDVQACVFDPLQFDRSAEQLGNEGVEMIEMPQTNARMAPASDALYQAIVRGELAHDGGPALAAQVAAGATTQTERGWRLTVRGAGGPVEALMALAMAFDAASRGLAVPRRQWTMAL